LIYAYERIREVNLKVDVRNSAQKSLLLLFLKSYQIGIAPGKFYEEPLCDDSYPDW